MKALYREANPEPDYVGGVLYPREAAAVQMWVVPASVDDLNIEALIREAAVAGIAINISEAYLLLRAALEVPDE